MPETPGGIYYPDETGHIPDVPADMKKAGESVEGFVDDSIGTALTAAAGRIPIAQKAGPALFKVMKGDAALTEDGTLMLAAANKPLAWYPPKIIATEQSRESSAYGMLGTPDEIEGVVVPAGALIMVGYTASVKSSVGEAGFAGLFLDSVQTKTATGVAVEANSNGTSLTKILTVGAGLSRQTTVGEVVTTGQTLGSANVGGALYMYAAAGTYDFSIRYKATSGSVTAKDRKLWVAVFGF